MASGSGTRLAKRERCGLSKSVPALVRGAACLLLAGVLGLGLLPTPALEEAAAAAAAANGTTTITHNPVGGTFSLNNPVRLYVNAFSSANNLLSYQWYRTTTNAAQGGEPVGESSSILVDSSNPPVGTYYYYAEVTDAATGEKVKSNPAAVNVVDKGTIYPALYNGDFEDESTKVFNEHNRVVEWPPWDTTHNGSVNTWEGKAFEIGYPPATYGLSAEGHGRGVVELAASAASSLYQEVSAVPGSVYSFSVDHGGRATGRDTSDSAAVVIGPAIEGIWNGEGADATYPYGQNDTCLFNKVVEQAAIDQGFSAATDLESGKPYSTVFEGNRYFVLVMTDKEKTWGHYEGTYTVPENQGTSVFAFVNVLSQSAGFGNILDNIVFTQGQPIEASSDVDSLGNGVLTATTKDGYSYGILEARGSTVTAVSGFTVANGSGAAVVEDASLTGAAGWYTPGAGTLSFGNLTPGKTYRIVEVPTSAIGGVMGLNLSPASVLDENCYDEFAVKPVSGGGASSIGNIQVTARNESDGTCTLVVDPARGDVEYAVLDASGATVKEWASSNTGRLVIPGLAPGTTYKVVGRPVGYNEVTYAQAALSGADITTPPASFKDVKEADVSREAGNLTVQNSASQAQKYMVYDVDTKVAVGDGWYSLNAGASQVWPIDAAKTYQVVTCMDGVVPAPGVRSYSEPAETLAIDFVTETLPAGSPMPASLQYRARDVIDASTWYFGGADNAADPWATGTGGSRVSLTGMLEAMSAAEEVSGAESKGATFAYRRTPEWAPAVIMEKTLDIPARPEAPVQGTASSYQNAGYWINWSGDPALVAGSGAIQVRVAGSSAWTNVAAGKSYGLGLLGWTEVAPLAIEVRAAAVADVSFASEVEGIELPARAEAPEGPKGKKSADGACRIDGVTDAMEYREWGTVDWAPVPSGATSVTGISDGTYEVRTKATDTAPASFSVTVSTTDAALSVNAMATRFAPQPWGYVPGNAAKELTIANTGTADAAIKNVEFTGEAAASFSLIQGSPTGTVKAGVTDTSRRIAPVAGLEPGVYQATAVVSYGEADGGSPTSYSTAVQLVLVVEKATQDAPGAPSASSQIDTQLVASAPLPNGYTLASPTIEFSIDGGITWNDGTAKGNNTFECLFTGLSAATRYEVLARMKADDNRIVSDESYGYLYTAYAAPAANQMRIDFGNETVSFGAAYEATSGAGGTGDALATGGSVSAYLGGATEFSLRRAQQVNLDKTVIPASAWTSVPVPARPAAPTGLTVVDADSSKASNGSITVPGATSVQYRKAGDTAWIPVNSGTITGLAAGDYEVRLSATSSAFASMGATVTVEAAKERFLSFNLNGGDGEAPATQTLTTASGWKGTAPSPAPTRANYAFAGWYEATGTAEDGSPTLAASSFDFAGTALDADLTLYAKWTANTYTIAFDAGGGKPAPGSQSSVSYEGTATEPAAPAKAGWAFAGWAFSNRAADNTETFDFDAALAQNFAAQGATPPQNGQTATLVAQWTPLSYNVSFDAATGNTADNPAAPGTTALNSTVSKPAEPTRPGYTFGGWRLAGAPAGKDYQFAKTLEENFALAGLTPGAAGSDVFIEAQWTERTFTVSFDADGGGSTPGPQDVLYTGTVTEPASGSTSRLGYTFSRWGLVDPGNPDAEPKAFDFGKSLAENLEGLSLEPPASGKVTLKAVWSVNSYKVTYDFNIDGDEGDVVRSPVLWTETAAAPEGEPLFPGFSFTGWSAGMEVKFDPAKTLEENYNAGALPSLAYPDGGAITLSPQFSAKTYELLFDADASKTETQGDTKVGPVSYEHAIENPLSIAVPQKVGYDFAAWHLVDAEGNSAAAAFELDTMLKANFESAGLTPPATQGAQIRLVPSFTARTYTLVIDLNRNGQADDGEETAEVAYDAAVADTLAAPADPVRPGYTFGGWTIKGATGNASFAFADTLEENCTALAFDPGAKGSTLFIQPVWNANSFLVSYDACGGAPTPTPPEAAVPVNGKVSGPTSEPARPGYAFGGWRLVTGGTADVPVLAGVNYDFALDLEQNLAAAGFDLAGGDTTGKPVVPAAGGTVTLAAAWTPNTYELVFDANQNGAADTGESQQVGSDGKATAPDSPAKPGYTFAGTWHLKVRAEGKDSVAYDFGLSLIENLAAAGYATQASAGAAASGPAVPANKAKIMLEPDWGENSYQLAFKADPLGTDAGLADPNPLASVRYTQANVSMPSIERAGFTFLGWSFNATPTASDHLYAPAETLEANLAAAGFDTDGGDPLKTDVPENDATIQLYAVWTAIPLSVEIPTEVMAEMGFDTETAKRTIAIKNADALKIASLTKAPLYVTAVMAQTGAGAATLFPDGLTAGEAKVELSMNGAVVFDGAGTEKQTSAVSGDAFSLAESDGAVATSCPLTFALSVPDAVPTALSLGPRAEADALSLVSLMYTISFEKGGK